jgi:hypothetical protein
MYVPVSRTLNTAGTQALARPQLRLVLAVKTCSTLLLNIMVTVTLVSSILLINNKQKTAKDINKQQQKTKDNHAFHHDHHDLRRMTIQPPR